MESGIGLIFTGQGAQYSGMGQDLLVYAVSHCTGYTLSLVEVNVVENTLGRKPVLLSNLPEYQMTILKVIGGESRLSRDHRLRKVRRLDLLRTPATDWNPLEARWRKLVNVSETPWVVDHKVRELFVLLNQN